MKLLSRALFQVLCACGPRGENGTRCNRYDRRWLVLLLSLHCGESVRSVGQPRSPVNQVIWSLGHSSCVHETTVCRLIICDIFYTNFLCDTSVFTFSFAKALKSWKKEVLSTYTHTSNFPHEDYQFVWSLGTNTNLKEQPVSHLHTMRPWLPSSIWCQ